MPRTRHQATAPDGRKFQRTSQTRTYSHCVMGILSETVARAWANSYADHPSILRNFDYYKGQGKTEALYGATTAEEYREVMRSRALANVDAKRAAGDYDRYVPLAWCSRIDLAHKEQAKHARSYRDIVIAEAVIF